MEQSTDKALVNTSGQKDLKSYFVLKAATRSTALGISRTFSFTK